jgi:hypothetical protein
MTVNITLRLPEDLHAWLVEQAKANERSMHAEILWLLKRAHASR